MVIRCPICEKDGLDVNGICRLCGAERRFTSDGHELWWRRGSILKCFTLEKQAFITMAKAQGIPESEWPDLFREK